ncbi:MAG: hypothetical protein ABSD96_14695, partial [Candidatus Korobacteraceae bacterium]
LDKTVTAEYKTPIFIAGAPSTDVDIVDNQIIDSLEPSRMRTAMLLATSTGASSGMRICNNPVSLHSVNRSSFLSYLEILDDRTRPLLVEAWEDFVAPSRKVAAGSNVTDPKSGAQWRADSGGSMSRQR